MKSKNVGTITVNLQINEFETGNAEIPSYLGVRGALIHATTLSDDQLKSLEEDNRPEGIIGFENGCIDAAVGCWREVPHDPRVAILGELIRSTIAPNFTAGACNEDAIKWLAKIDAAH